MMLATPSWAGWQVNNSDDGSFYYGSAMLSSTAGAGLFEVFCGGRSPQGLDPMVTGNVEPSLTKPGEMGLYLSTDLIGAQSFGGGARTDVMIVVGALGYRLPAVTGNELIGTWEQHVQLTDPLVAALQSGTPMDIRTGAGGRVVLDTIGAAKSISQALEFCAIKAKTAPRVDLNAAVDAYIFEGCGGAASATSNYLLRGDLDRDGREDIVLDWSAVTCPGAMPRPFCGAANCSVDVFLSSIFARKGLPEMYLGLGPELVMRAEGLELIIGGTYSLCGAVQDRLPCQRYGWNGAALVSLP